MPPPSAADVPPPMPLPTWAAMASPWGAWLRPNACNAEMPAGERLALGVRLAEECQRLEELISRFSPRSEVFRINRDAALHEVLLDRETSELLEFVAFACDFTGGAFNPLRRKPAAGPASPPQWSDVAFDAERRRLRFLRPDVELDLGAVGKGWALERLAEVLLEYGAPPALVSAGGSSWLAVGGPVAEEAAEGGVPWQAPLADPWNPGGATLEDVPLCEAGLSISWVHPGRAAEESAAEPVSPSAAAATASDLWDASGAPLVRPQAGCMVRHPSPTFAEVLSTALLAAEDPAREALLAKLHDMPGCAVAWLHPPDRPQRVEWKLDNA